MVAIVVPEEAVSCAALRRRSLLADAMRAERAAVEDEASMANYYMLEQSVRGQQDLGGRGMEHGGSEDSILTRTSAAPMEKLKQLWPHARRRALKAFSRKTLFRRLPVLSWLPHYNAHDALGDLVAGVTVGLTVIPQSLAYSNVAGLPAQYGLYGSFLGCFLYIVMGSCKDVPMGPTAICALLTYQTVRGLEVQFAILLCFLVGCIQLLMGVLGLGFVIDFVSGPVSSGFTSAVALLIVTSQVKDVLGVSATGSTFIEMWGSLIQKMGDTRPWDTLLGGVCILVLLLMRMVSMIKIGPKELEMQTKTQKIVNKTLWLIGTSRNAILVILCGVIGYKFYSKDEPPFRLIGYIPPGLPSVQLPPFGFQRDANTTISFLEMCTTMGSGVVVLPLVALLENIAVCKAFSNGKSVDATQELLALGICNIGNSLVQGFPGSGSLSRSAVNNSSGVRTPLGGLYTGVLVIVALLFCTPYFAFIPKAALAAIIIAAVIFMVEVHVVIPMWKTKKSDLIPGMGTFVACLVLQLEYGIVLGIGINVLFILYHAARPKIAAENLTSPGGLEYLMLTPDRCLIFPSVGYVRNLVTKHSIKQAIPVVIDCSHIYGADYTAAKVIECLTQDFSTRRQPLFFYKLKPSVVAVFEGLRPKDFVVYNSENELDGLIKAHKKVAAESEVYREISVVTTG